MVCARVFYVVLVSVRLMGVRPAVGLGRCEALCVDVSLRGSVGV